MRRRELDSVRERAEMALLGILLLSPERRAEPVGLEARHFFYPWNTVVFEAISAGGDRYAVARRMVETGTIEELHYVGRIDYLARLLVAGATCQANLAELASFIQRCPRCHR